MIFGKNYGAVEVWQVVLVFENGDRRQVDPGVVFIGTESIKGNVVPEFCKYEGVTFKYVGTQDGDPVYSEVERAVPRYINESPATIDVLDVADPPNKGPELKEVFLRLLRFSRSILFRSNNRLRAAFTTI